MVFLFAAVLIFFVGMILLSKGSLNSAYHIRRALSTFLLLLLLATLGFFFLRTGTPYLAGIVAAVMAILAFMQRIQTIFSVLRSLKTFSHYLFKKKKLQHEMLEERLMTKEEARKILQVPANANHAEIKKAYYEMMRKNHPDQGGSSDMASKINQARDVLLK